MVRANEMLWRLVRISPIAELQVGREGGKEFTGRDAQPFGTAQVAEVDLAERVAALVTDTARRVIAEEHLGRIVDAVDPIHQDEVALSFWKHDPLRPARSRFAAGRGVLVTVGRRYRDEIFPLEDLRLHRLHAVAELRSLDHPLPMAAAVGHEGIGSSGWFSFVGVPGITADAVPIRSDHLVAPGCVAARLHEPVNNHQTIADFAEAGGLIQERSLFDAS